MSRIFNFGEEKLSICAIDHAFTSEIDIFNANVDIFY